LAEVDWVVTSPCLTKPEAPVRGPNEADAAWQTRERDFAPIKMSYDLEHKKWFTTNKKCLAVIKNTIEPAIVGSIPKCDTVTEYLDRIKSQFTGSSKTCYPAYKTAGDREVFWRWQWYKRAHTENEQFGI
jgi:hypothetical protein